MTGAWTDPDARPGVVIVLEMGGSSDLCALLQPGEPVVLMGPTGTPTEIHAKHRRVGRRRPGQRGAVLHRRGAARGRIEGDLFRRLQARSSDRYKVERNRTRRRRDRLVLRRGARLHPAARGRRTAASSATSCRRWRPMPSGALGDPAIPLSEARPHDRHRLGSHDAGGRRCPAWRAGAVPEAGPHRGRFDQLARCSA